MRAKLDGRKNESSFYWEAKRPYQCNQMHGQKYRYLHASKANLLTEEPVPFFFFRHWPPFPGSGRPLSVGRPHGSRVFGIEPLL